MSLTTGGCLVEHDDGEAGWRHVLVGRDPLGEFVEENLHHGRVGARHDKPERIAGCRLHGREDVGDKCSACSDAAGVRRESTRHSSAILRRSEEVQAAKKRYHSAQPAGDGRARGTRLAVKLRLSRGRRSLGKHFSIGNIAMGGIGIPGVG